MQFAALPDCQACVPVHGSTGDAGSQEVYKPCLHYAHIDRNCQSGKAHLSSKSSTLASSPVLEAPLCNSLSRALLQQMS